MKLPLTTHLAILQQAEYDLDLWFKWNKRPHDQQQLLELSALKLEKMTPKLKLLKTFAQMLWPLGPHIALAAALVCVAPFNYFMTEKAVREAKQKLRDAQRKGLIVIAIAGSYGKTSVKHISHHIFSQHFHTLMTPESVNTPLGIAQIIQKRLTSRHKIFIVELGEYQPGDLEQLLRFVRPKYALVSPIGFTHANRFGTEEIRRNTFNELLTSQYAPKKVISTFQNREVFSADVRMNYVGDENTEMYLTDIEEKIEDTSATLNYKGELLPLRSNITGQTHLQNALLPLALLKEFDVWLEKDLSALQYVPPIDRRLTVQRSPNGTIVVDNSYNTNPGSWKQQLSLIESLPTPRTIIVSGFVELSEEENDVRHEEMAKNLLELGQIIGVIESAENKKLCEYLQAKKRDQTIIFSRSLNGVLTELTTQKRKFATLWMEGGMREIYQ